MTIRKAQRTDSITKGSFKSRYQAYSLIPRPSPLLPVSAMHDLVTAPLESPSEVLLQLTPDQLEEWDACRVLLREAGMTSDEAIDRALARGFAWTSRWYYGSERMNEPPEPGQLIESLSFLQGTLGISGEDLNKVLAKFPEALSCSVDERMEPNMRRFQSEWSMSGDVLKRAIVRKPTLLGLAIDCSKIDNGSCQGQCSKCWAAN